jgi:CRP/FNR family transcriptional regulator, dissimilatory nitrate respiration regulator
MPGPADAWASAGLPERLAAAVGAAGTIRRLAAGEALFRQADPARAIFAVLSGRVQLLRHTSAGQRVLLHDARPGELLAEAALFAEAYHCDATAAIAAEVRVLPKPALHEALRRDPALALGLAGTLAHQVQALRGRLALRDLRPARERVLAGLALHAGPGGGAVRLPGTLADFAAEIGLTHEALYRTLASLEREGRIERTGATAIRLVLPSPGPL